MAPVPALPRRLWLAALCVALPAWGAPSEDAKLRLKRYEALLATSSPTVRIDAIRELRQADDPKIAETLLNHAFLDDFRVAEAAVRFLARTGTPPVMEWIRKQGALKSDPRARFYTLRLQSVLQNPPESDAGREPVPLTAAVLEPYVRDPHWILRLEAATALGKCPEEAAVPLLKILLTDKVEPVRCVAILGLADHGVSALLPEFRNALLDKDWRVRSAALEALVRLKDLEAVPLIRQVLEKETEFRMIDDLSQALNDLGAAKEEVQEQQAEEARREAEHAPAIEGTEEAVTQRATRFAGIDYGKKIKELKSLQGRIVFVMDCSASMAEHVLEHPVKTPTPPKKDDYKVEEKGEVKRIDRPTDEQAMGYERNQPGKPAEEAFPPTKLGFCQRELCRALRQLKPEISFNIICFQSAGKQKAWKPVLTQASAGAVSEAIAFVKRQAPEG